MSCKTACFILQNSLFQRVKLPVLERKTIGLAKPLLSFGLSSPVFTHDDKALRALLCKLCKAVQQI